MPKNTLALDNLEKLLGEDKFSHTSKTLLEHLKETSRLLEQWNAPDYICLAGLYHSIYGTQYYKKQPIDIRERDRIRTTIGDKAERLAFYFCNQDRSLFLNIDSKDKEFFVIDYKTGLREDITEQDYRDLLELHLANYLEQMPRRSAKYRNTYYQVFLRNKSFLSKQGFVCLSRSMFYSKIKQNFPFKHLFVRLKRFSFKSFS